MTMIKMKIHCRIYLDYKMEIKYLDRNKTKLINQQGQRHDQILWEDLK